MRPVIEAFSRALAQEAHHLRHEPTLLFQQLYNRMTWAGESAVVQGTVEALLEGARARHARWWLRLLNPALDSPACLRTLKGHTNYVNACAFSPDGRRLASAGHGGEVRIWDVQTGAPIAALAGDWYHTYAVAFSPNGKRLALADAGNIYIIDVENGRLLRKFERFEGSPDGVRLEFEPPLGNRLITQDWGTGRIVIWDVATGEGHSILPDGTPHCFSKAGDLLALDCAPEGFQIRRWSGGSGPIGLRPTRPLVNLLRPKARWAFSPDRNLLAFCTIDNTLHVWSLSTNKQLAERRFPVGLVVACVRVNGETFAVFTGPGSRRLFCWKVTEGEVVEIRGHDEGIKDGSVSPDGRRMATASWDWTVKLWDTHAFKTLEASVRERDTLDSGCLEWLATLGSAFDSECTLEREDGSVLRVDEEKSSPAEWVESPFRYVGGGQSGVTRLRIHDSRSDRVISTSGGHPTSPVSGVAFDADATMMASVGWDGWIRLWDLVDGASLASFPTSGPLGKISFSQDGEFLRAESQGGTEYLLKLMRK